MKNSITLRNHKGIGDREIKTFYDFDEFTEYGTSDYRLLCGNTYYYFNKALYELVEIKIY